MKKKIFSIILAVALVASMMTVAMVSVSASIDGDGRYVPADPDSTYRYYFYMPRNWENSFTKSTIGGVYWFGGTEACSSIDGSTGSAYPWPGYVAQYEGTYDEGSVYYVDCPDDVAAIIWNNYVNGGTHKDGVYETSKEQFEAAKQTIDISGLDDAETYCNYDLYPEGLEDFDNMIYIIDGRPEKVTVNELSGKETYGGDWYYYYGDGKYGVQPTLEEAEAAGEVKDTAYQPPMDQDATPVEPVKPVNPGTQDPTTAPTTAAAGNNDSTNPTAGSPSGNASSSTNDTAKNTTTDNGTVQTGDASSAFIILFSVAAAVGVAIFARKKIFG